MTCGVLVEVVRPDGTREALPCSGYAFIWGGERFDRRVQCGHEQHGRLGEHSMTGAEFVDAIREAAPDAFSDLDDVIPE